MTTEPATLTLHRLTWSGSFDLEHAWDPPVTDPKILTDLVVNDMGRFPWFFKRYDDSLPRLSLPRQLPSSSADTVAVLAGTAQVPPGRLDLAHLSRLLYLSAGVVRVAHRDVGPFLFRAAGSAGGRFPLEVYALIPGGIELPAGVHWYHPQDHALVRIGPPPEGDSPAVVVTGVPWRTGWRYRERGYRHIYWDAGSMLAQLLAAADSVGVPARLVTRFPDSMVADATGADGTDEWPVAVVALGPGGPAIHPTGPARAGRVDAAPVEFPLVTEAQRAGDADIEGRDWPRGPSVAIAAVGHGPVEGAILARGSQRRMDPSGEVPRTVLAGLAAAVRGITVPHYVAVHGVEGVRAGLYRWPDLAAPVRPGNLRLDLYRACMNQSLGHDAAFVVIAATDLSTLTAREYREVHLAAGLASGRMHLHAYTLGAGASGMTFVDGLIPELLGQPLAGLLFTCVGVPEYQAAAGGPPGAPATIRMVTPRLDNH